MADYELQEKYQRLAQHVKNVEHAHRSCKELRYSKAIRELEKLRDSPGFDLPRLAYQHIEDRLKKLTLKRRFHRQKARSKS